MPSSSITRRSRDTNCPICPAKRHSSSSDTAPEAPPQFVRIGQIFLPTLNRNWVELACTSKSKKPPPVSTTTMNPQRPARRDSNPRPMTWETSVFPICYCPMCCVPAVPTTRPLPPPTIPSSCCCGLHLVQTFKAQIGHDGRSPVASLPPSPPTATREPRVFLVCSSPVVYLVLPSLTSVLPSYPSSWGCH